jgi:CDP-glucose 4,6-dehydratase
MLAERLPSEGITGEAFNFGPKQPLSVLEVVAQVLAAMGRSDLTPVILGEAQHEIPRQYLDCAKAHGRLGWQPRYTFDEGLRETIAWYREFLAR